MAEMTKSGSTGEGDMVDPFFMMKNMMRYGIFDPHHNLALTMLS